MDTNEMRCIKFSNTFPIINSNGQLQQYLIDSFLIYYYKDMVLLERPFENTIINDIDTTQNSFQINSKFFIYSKNFSQGYLMDTVIMANNQWIVVDSFLSVQDFVQNSKMFYDNFSLAETHLLSSAKNKDSGTLHEIYSTVNKKDSELKGTIYLSFIEQFPASDISLSPYLDSLKNMKLFKNRVVTDKRYWPKYNITVDPTEYSSSISEIQPPNEKLILQYFEIFEKELKSRSGNK